MNDMDTQEISTAIMAEGSSKGCALASGLTGTQLLNVYIVHT